MADAHRFPVPPVVAALPLSGHQVVEASAGTGKTYLIERRVVDLLLRGGVTLDQILLVTFTEKATAELRGRVRALVRDLTRLREHQAAPDQPAWLIDDRARAALRAALVGFDQAAIYTIHGFCHRVLTDSAFDARRPFRQTQVATEAALREALSDCLRDTLSVDDQAGALLEAYLGGGNRRIDGLARLLGELLRTGGRLVQRFCPEELSARLERLAALFGGPGEELLRAALKAEGVHGNTAGAVIKRGRTLLDLAERGREDGLLAVVDAVGSEADGLRGLKWPEPAGEISARIRDAAGEVAEAAVPLLAAVAARFLPAVQERLDRNKAERGQFDFGDMLEQVWRALDGPGGAALAERLRQRYPHALIDEFQDTDPVQWSIFRRIYLEAPAGRAHLTVVGDPKQAIYGFRGADLATYLEARAQILGAATGEEPAREPVRLDVSYRATPALCRAQGRVFGGASRFFSGGVDFSEVGSGRKHPGDEGGALAGPPLRLWDLTALPDRPAERRRAALAQRISREIAALTAGGVAPGRIFVLTRSNPESREMAERLRQDGIRAALYQQEGLLQTEEAAEVRDLLAAIARPGDRSARLRAFATRFFAVPTAALGALAEASDSHPLVAQLLGWKSLADRHDYERLFPRILRQSRVIEREIVLAPSERALTNILHLFEILLDEMLVARSDIDELGQRLGHWITDTEKSEERNVQRLESERDAVQIMTIHRSKGLEADVVFLYGATGRGGFGSVSIYHAGGERRLQVGKTRDAAIAAAIEEEERGENQRLAYVALTRAARRLYLPCWEEDPDKTKAARSVGELVNARVQGWLEDGGDGEELVVVERIEGAGGERRADDAARALASWQPPAGAPADPGPDAALARALVRQRGPITTSYTRMKRAAGGLPPFDRLGGRLTAAAAGGGAAATDIGGAIDDGEDEDERAEVIATATGPEDPGAGVGAAGGGARQSPPGNTAEGGRRVGIFLHEVLEAVPLPVVTELAAAGDEGDEGDEACARWAALPETERAFREAAARHDVDLDAASSPWTSMVWRALSCPLGFGDGLVIPGVAAAERHMREVEFAFPLRGPDGRERAMVRGAIDLVFEYQGRIYWLDWKSDALPSMEPRALAAHVESEYRLQADVYSLALSRILGLRGPADHAARFGGLVYLFLRGPAVHVERPDWDQLRAREHSLQTREVLG